MGYFKDLETSCKIAVLDIALNLSKTADLDDQAIRRLLETEAGFPVAKEPYLLDLAYRRSIGGQRGKGNVFSVPIDQCYIYAAIVPGIDVVFVPPGIEWP